jgi:hypothetical protein
LIILISAGAGHRCRTGFSVQAMLHAHPHAALLEGPVLRKNYRFMPALWPTTSLTVSLRKNALVVWKGASTMDTLRSLVSMQRIRVQVVAGIVQLAAINVCSQIRSFLCHSVMPLQKFPLNAGTQFEGFATAPSS